MVDLSRMRELDFGEMPAGSNQQTLDHLAGRKVKCASDEEVERIARETAWGPSAAHSAIATMIRENRARKAKETPSTPM